MTRTMRAIRLDEVGPPSNLKVVEIPKPSLPDDGVVIRTEYAGIIYADAEARRGTYYRQTVLPWYPGREVAGTVEAVGKKVSAYAPGDRVAALVLAGGCYADCVVARTVPQPLPAGGAIPPSDIVPLPDEVGEAEALCYLVNFRLAHLLTHAWSRLSEEMTILVHGASGGMGSMILDIARRIGCTTIALVRNDAEAQFCSRLGASHCIDITRTDYVAETIRLCGRRGIDRSFNGVGGDTIGRDPALVAPFGEILLYGYVAGKREFDPFAVDRTIALKTFAADDFFAGKHFARATAAMHARFADGDLVEPGRIFPLTQAAAAHQALEQGDFCGKILLRP